MKLKMKNLLLLLILLILFSCRKFKFNEVENEMLQVYSIGDTLIFKSVKTGDIENFVIMDKTNDIESLAPLSFARKHNARIKYRNIKNPAYTNPGYQYSALLYIENEHKYNDIVVGINYSHIRCHNDLGTINKTDTLFCFNKKIIDYYTLNDTDKPDTISKIIWQKK